MSIKYDLPRGAVLSRQLPTKTKLPASSRVQGGFVHAFELCRGNVRVLMRLHVRVRTYSEIQKTLKWKMEALPGSNDGCAEFQLTPADKSAKVTILGIGLYEPVPDSDVVRLHFEDHDMHASRYVRKQAQDLTLRRVRRATYDAERIGATA